MESSKKFTDKNLQGEELEKFTEEFLTAKFDRDRKKRWQKILEEKHGVQSSPPEKPKRKAKVLYLWMGAIAAAILLLFILNPGFLQFSNPSYEILADNYIAREFFQNQDVFKGDEDIEILKINAVTAYNNKDFPNAIENYEKLIALNERDPEHLFFLGMSYLYDEKYAKAIEMLLPIANAENNSKFKLESQWFLSLAYLKIKNPEQARPLLEAVKNSNWNADKASQLLEALE